MALTKISGGVLQQPIEVGIITATSADFSGIVTASSIVATTGTFSGNVSIAGTLTYEDVTNIDSIGIVTARSTIDAQGNVTVGAGLSVVGVSTLSNTVVGGATTELIVGGDARITGILTIGSSSITLDGSNNQVNVGTGITIHHTNGIQVGENRLHSSGITINSLLGTPQIAGISSSISDTAVDIFIYDTSKDSDGGAWRKRTQHTSWYNETLNTATRGSRREFPAVAVIVASTYSLTIYDGDDPDLPLWMKFTGGGNSLNYLDATNPESCAAINGILYTGGGSGSIEIRFISDDNKFRNVTRQYNKGNIAERNSAKGWVNTGGSDVLVNSNVNDVAMTVLPNAPIDSATGLPVPTIAVATDGGVSVIKDDGTVVDMTVNGQSTVCLEINFIGSDNIAIRPGDTGWIFYYNIPSSDLLTTYWNGLSGYLGRWTDTQRDWGGGDNGIPINVGASGIGNFIEDKAAGHTNGLEILYTDLSSFANGMHAGISTDFNTGWMHGDIKGAFLSDTNATNVTGGELFTNSQFTNDVTGWGSYTGNTNITWSSGQALVTLGDGYYNGIAQDIALIIGKKYTITTKVTTGTYVGAIAIPYAGVAWMTYKNFNSGQTQTITHTFTATTSSGTFGVVAFTPSGTPGQTYYVDYFSVTLAEEDRSVNNNGLQVFGTITKSPVAGSGATAAELVAYSGFSASNYLRQPINSGLNFGTSNFSVMGWFKLTSNNTQQCLMMIQNLTGELDYFLIEQQSNGDMRFQVDVYNGASVAYYTTLPTGVWIHYCGLKVGSRSQLYINGSRNGELHNGLDYDLANNSFDITDDGLFIGRRSLTNDPHPFTGSMALWRISASIPSPEQIKKIYEDEKVLFQENAKCTLYGSSDAVTALAYDEVTERLHVGTSSGRSDFQGLRRINNTTTAVTTAISAHDEFIVEQ